MYPIFVVGIVGKTAELVENARLAGDSTTRMETNSRATTALRPLEPCKPTSTEGDCREL